MKTKSLLVLLTLVVASGGAFALDLGEEITIYDGVGVGTGWYGAQEDNEVEPGCVGTDDWDLEGFFLNGTLLTMVGTFDFENGVPDGAGGAWESGDLFIDVDGDVVYGPDAALVSNGGADVMTNVFGYDYVLVYKGDDEETGDPLFDAIAIGADDVVEVFYDQNAHANPWRYAEGGQVVHSGTFDYFTGLASGDVGGLSGLSHNAVQVDLGFLYDFAGVGEDNITLHFTQECGNDNLMGQIVVPEPATMVLLGLGLAGIATTRMRKRAA